MTTKPQPGMRWPWLVAFVHALSTPQLVKSILRQSLVDKIPLLLMAHTLQR
jgi:hypothetical protein